MAIRSALAVVGAASLALGGCGGTKILKEPYELPATTVLSSASDPALAVQLDWVVVRDGPGAWARGADWDEYLLRVANPGDEPLRIDSITLIDSVGHPISPGSNRASLVRGSKMAAKRYADADIEIHAGMTGAGLFATATGMMIGGGYLAAQSLAAIVAGTGATALGGYAAVVALYGAPIVMAGGVARGINNKKVNAEIIRRQTELPLEVPAQTSDFVLDIFFPISPSPGRIEFVYSDAAGEQVLILDTRKALDGLHLEMLAEAAVPPEQPDAPVAP